MPTFQSFFQNIKDAFSPLLPGQEFVSPAQDIPDQTPRTQTFAGPLPEGTAPLGEAFFRSTGRELQLPGQFQQPPQVPGITGIAEGLPAFQAPTGPIPEAPAAEPLQEPAVTRAPDVPGAPSLADIQRGIDEAVRTFRGIQASAQRLLTQPSPTIETDELAEEFQGLPSINEELEDIRTAQSELDKQITDLETTPIESATTRTLFGDIATLDAQINNIITSTEEAFARIGQAPVSQTLINRRQQALETIAGQTIQPLLRLREAKGLALQRQQRLDELEFERKTQAVGIRSQQVQNQIRAVEQKQNDARDQFNTAFIETEAVGNLTDAQLQQWADATGMTLGSLQAIRKAIIDGRKEEAAELQAEAEDTARDVAVFAAALADGSVTPSNVPQDLRADAIAMAEAQFGGVAQRPTAADRIFTPRLFGLTGDQSLDVFTKDLAPQWFIDDIVQDASTAEAPFTPAPGFIQEMWEKFQTQSVEQHNEIRQQVGANQPLIDQDALAEAFSQALAEQ